MLICKRRGGCRKQLLSLSGSASIYMRYLSVITVDKVTEIFCIADVFICKFLFFIQNRTQIAGFETVMVYVWKAIVSFSLFFVRFEMLIPLLINNEKNLKVNTISVK